MTSDEKFKIKKMKSKGESYTKIAEKIGVPVSTVKSFWRRNNLQNEVVKNENFQNECKNCKNELVILEKQKSKMFCSDKCRWQWWNRNRDKISKNAVTIKCKNCGQTFESYSRQLFCKHPCYISWRFNFSR